MNKLRRFTLCDQKAFHDFLQSPDPPSLERPTSYMVIEAYQELRPTFPHSLRFPDQGAPFFAVCVQWNWNFVIPAMGPYVPNTNRIASAQRFMKYRHHDSRLLSSWYINTLSWTATLLLLSNEAFCLHIRALLYPILSSYMMFKAEAILLDLLCTSGLFVCLVLSVLLCELIGPANILTSYGEGSKRSPHILIKDIIMEIWHRLLWLCLDNWLYYHSRARLRYGESILPVSISLLRWIYFSDVPTIAVFF